MSDFFEFTRPADTLYSSGLLVGGRGWGEVSMIYLVYFYDHDIYIFFFKVLLLKVLHNLLGL